MDRLLDLDRALFLLLNGQNWPGWLDAFFVTLTDDRHWRFPLLGVWLVLLVFCGPRWRRRAIWLVPLVALADALNSQVVKEIFQRARPCREGLEGLRLLVDCGPAYSFPSSHAANMGAAGVFLALGLRSLKLRRLVLLPALLVAYSRVHVGVHYPMDVVGGFVEGALLAWGAHALLARVKRPWGNGRKEA